LKVTSEFGIVWSRTIAALAPHTLMPTSERVSANRLGLVAENVDGGPFLFGVNFKDGMAGWLGSELNLDFLGCTMWGKAYSFGHSTST
jgi:hypothetical protein